MLEADGVKPDFEPHERLGGHIGGVDAGYGGGFGDTGEPFAGGAGGYDAYGGTAPMDTGYGGGGYGGGYGEPNAYG